MSPFEDKTSQNVNEHITFIEFVLGIYSLTMGNVVALVADNRSTIKSIARKLNRQLIGCACHRYQLAVQNVIAEDGDMVELVEKLMKMPRIPLVRARLQKSTHLKEKIINITRWISTFKMSERHVEVRPFVA